MATDNNFVVKNGLEVGGALIVNSSGQLVVATVSSNITFQDNVKAQFGASSDLQIYHDGSNSYIDESGTGGLILKGGGSIFLKSPANENMIVATGNGAVTLYYDNAEKLATTSTGIDVTGNIVADGGTIDGTFIVDGGTGVDSTGVFHVRQDGDAANNGIAITSSNATSHRIWKDGSGNLNIGSSTVTDAFKQDLSGNITIAGEIYAKDSNSTTDPTYTFTGHTNTGLAVYQVSSIDRLSIITGGAQRANFGTHGVESFANVYTGNTSAFRNYGGEWHATTGVTGNGFRFTNTADSVDALVLTAAGNATFAGTISSGSIESTGTINIDTADTTLPNTYFSAERYNDSNGKLIFGVGEASPTGGTTGETFIGNHNRRLHLGSVFDGVNHEPTASVMHFMIDEDGDLYVSQNNTHTQWFQASTRNLSNIGTISSGAITSSSTATASGGFITTSDLALRDYTTDARIHLGDASGGASGVFAGRRLTTNGGLLYGTYWAYDAFWDDTNQNWTANRSTLGRKWKAEMGYHIDAFKVSRFDGTVSSSWDEADWTNLFVITSTTAAFATDINLTSGHVYKINGTTVIDSTRNLTNIGTISSGAITSSGEVEATALDINGNGDISGNLTLGGYLAGPATFTIDPAAVGDNTGTVVIAGNLQVDGTTTTINSTTLTVDDKNITLASGSTNSGAANGAGLTVDCGSDTDTTFTYNGTSAQWETNTELVIQPRHTSGTPPSLTLGDLNNQFQSGISSSGHLTMRANGSGNLYWQNSSTYLMVLSSGGNLSIGNGSTGGSEILNVTGNIAVTGTVDGRDIATDGTKLDTIDTNADVTPSWVPSSDPNYLTGNQTITLSGDVSGSGTTSIAVTIADDSHNHVISNIDGLQTALDGKLNLSGGTMTGTLTGVQITATTTADATPAIIATNTGGINGVIQRWVGESDSMELRNMDTGDYELMNTQQNNGIIFRDGTGGVEIHYNGAEVVEVGSLGGLVLISGALQIPNNLQHKDDSDTYLKFDDNRVRIVNGNNTYLDTNNGTAVLHTGTTFGGDVSGTYDNIAIADDSHNHVISNVDGLQTALDGKLSTTGTAANSQLLDSLDSTQFLRSDADDSYSGVLSLTGELTLASSTTRIDGSDGHPLVQVNSSRAYFGSTNRSVSTIATSSTTGLKANVNGTDYTVFHAGNSAQFTSALNTKLSGIATGADVTPSWVPSSDPSYATQSYVNTQVSNLVDSAPSTLDTLNELAAALGDDANFSTTVTNSIATKLPLAGGTMTGAINAGGGINGLTLSNGISGNNYNITGVNQLTINDPGEGIVFGGGSTTMSLAIVDDATDRILRYSGTGAVFDVQGNITLTGTVDGRDVAADGTKLDGIESGATADQTQSEINALGITATGLSGTPNITVGTISSGAITASGSHIFTTNDVDFIVRDTTDSITNYIWRDYSGSKLYLGTPTAVATIRSTLDLDSNNIINAGTISSGAITSSGRIKTTNGLFQADEGNQKFRQYEIGSGAGTQTFLLGKIENGGNADGGVTGTVKAAYDYGETVNNCNVHFTFAQRSGAARGHWWYENTDDDASTDVISVRLVDDGAGGMFVWLYVGDYVHCFVETVWRQCSSVTDSGTLSAGTITTGTTLFDTANDPTSEMHIGKLYPHDSIFLPDTKGIYLGGSNDLQLYHNGSNSLISNQNGDLYIRQQTDDGDIIFQADDGSGGDTEYFRLDGGNTNVSIAKNFLFQDNVRADFGNDSDLRIYHTGSHSYIDENGTGNLYIGSNNGGGVYINGSAETLASFVDDGAVTLYYDGSSRLTTTSTGIQVDGPNGNVTIGAQNTTGLHIYTDRDRFYFNKQTSHISNSITSYSGDFNLQRLESTKLTLTSTGASVTGNLTVSGTVDGRDIAADGSKLDGIESGATADQTAAEILSALLTVDGSGSGLDADLLDGYHKERYHRSALSTFSSGDWNNLTTHGTVKIQHSNFSNDTNPPPASYAYGIAEILEGEVGGENRTLQIYYPHNNTDRAHYIRMFNSSSWTDWRTVPHTVSGSQTVWHSNNDGSSSGLDADLLDGQHGSHYLNYNNFTNTPTIPTNNNQLTNGAGYITSSGNTSGTAGGLSGTPNITVGTISSGAITATTADFSDQVTVQSATSTPLSNLFPGSLVVKGSGSEDPIIAVTDSGTANAAAGVFHQSSTSPGFPALVINAASNASEQPLISARTNVSNTTGTGGTEVFAVDGGGDATFVGTISSGDITSSGNITSVTTGTSNAKLIADGGGAANVEIDRGSTSYHNNLLYRTAGAVKWRIWQSGADNILAIRNEVANTDVLSFTDTNATFAGTISSDTIEINTAINSNSHGIFIQNNSLTGAGNLRIAIPNASGSYSTAATLNDIVMRNETTGGSIIVGAKDSVILGVGGSDYDERLKVTTTGVDIAGALTATTKSFDIEHPTKEGMRLHHGVLEGPEHAVYIRGKSNSYIIELPDYWEGLVHEDTITVQLTPIGGQNDMWIENIEDNKVYINCEREMKQYFYFIQAERKDIERFEVEYES